MFLLFGARDLHVVAVEVTSRVPHLEDPAEFEAALKMLRERHESRLLEVARKGKLSRTQLRSLARQTHLQESLPSHMASVYLAFDEVALSDRELVGYVLEVIAAEDLGVGANDVPHVELSRRFAMCVGLRERDLRHIRPTPATRVLLDWCDMSELGRPWREALAVQLACESQFPLMDGMARTLQDRYGARSEDVAYWTVHGGQLERRHARAGLALLSRHVRRADLAGVLYAYEESCRLMARFYDSFT